jgi:hypothetical protein
MSPARESFNRWVAANIVPIIAYAILLTAWGLRLEAKVDAKADRATVEKMADAIDDIHTLICRDHPADSACKDEKPRPR